jgi:peptidoglycan/LPS O-acetylase OafA/YrhL
MLSILVLSSNQRVASLDGLRAVSILLVVASHLGLGLRHWFPAMQALLGWMGNLGVSVFFVISGFLITLLLLKEERQYGDISLKHFYIRRACRILPAYFAFLLATLIVWRLHFVDLGWGQLLAAATFTWNYSPLASGWTLAHCWSLAVEEQFYLLWPLGLSALLVLMGRRYARGMAITLILLAPFLRVGTYLLIPEWRGRTGMMLHTRIDVLMFGCFLALIYEDRRFREIRNKLLTPKVIVSSLIFLFAISPILDLELKGVYTLTLGFSLEGMAIALLVWWCVRSAETKIGRILNSRLFVHIGILSYSLYLWQQPFSNPDSSSVLGRFPLNLALIFVCAEGSYRIIETPFLNIRRKFDRKLSMQEPQAASAPAGKSTADAFRAGDPDSHQVPDVSKAEFSHRL